ncbi:MAG: Hsp20/alpha crystallin family protein [Nitrospiria bacterium]
MAKHLSGARSAIERVKTASPVFVPEQEGAGAPRLPLLDMYEAPVGLVVEVDLPGICSDDIRIEVSRNNLTIEGHRRGPCDQEKGCYLRVERHTAGFHRVISLPAAINPHAAVARYERGVLTITFPKIPDRRQEAIRIRITPE